MPKLEVLSRACRHDSVEDPGVYNFWKFHEHTSYFDRVIRDKRNPVWPYWRNVWTKYGRKTVLAYARPTDKNTMTESNKNSSTLGVIGVVRMAVLTPTGTSATRSDVTGLRNKSVVTEIYPWYTTYRSTSIDTVGLTRTVLRETNYFHFAQIWHNTTSLTISMTYRTQNTVFRHWNWSTITTSCSTSLDRIGLSRTVLQ